MTRDSTIAATRTLDRPDVWGIGRYAVGDEVVEWAISNADMERDTDWAAEVLAEYDIGRGSLVLVIATLGPDAPFSGPFLRAVHRLGGTVCHADVFGWDARRSDMFARRLPLSMVLGLNLDVWQGLSQGEMTEATGRVPHLLVRPEAVAPMVEAGLRPGIFLPLGPATAVTRAGHDGLHVNTDEFAVTERDGELRVTVLGDRRTRLDGAPTGRRGQVLADGSIQLR